MYPLRAQRYEITGQYIHLINSSTERFSTGHRRAPAGLVPTVDKPSARETSFEARREIRDLRRVEARRLRERVKRDVVREVLASSAGSLAEEERARSVDVSR